VLRSVEEYTAQAPDEVSPLGVLGRVPYDEMFPEGWHGEQYIALLAMYSGGVEEGERGRGRTRRGWPLPSARGPSPSRWSTNT
jgi:hypothetical protein